MNRIIKNRLLISVLIVCTAFSWCFANQNTATCKNSVLRFAHMSDIHLDNRNNSAEGLTLALRHVNALPDKSDMIIAGGDQVWDLMGADEETAAMQLSLFKQIFEKECELPVKYCLGNHELWGWNKEKSKTTGNEKLWGKKRFVHEFNMPGRYYSFDAGNWRIIILDSMVPDENNVYAARLDDEQFGWLQEQLKTNKDKNICVVSHIPIFSAAVLLRGKIENNTWCLNNKLIHFDAQKIMNLFQQYQNVRLCISGHSHLAERVEYDNITYICEGAVCGKWWRGKNRETEEGYGLFDLYDDGSFDYRYVDYGWEVKGK